MAKSKLAPKAKKVSVKRGKVKKGNVKRKEVPLGKMSMEDFMDNELEQSDEEPQTNNGTNSDNEGSDIDMDQELEKDDSDVEDNNAESDEDEAEDHKQSLAKLRDTDPEFYQFLQDNDKKLLQFNLSDDEQDNDEEDEDQEQSETLHKPSEQLEVASDESDYEDDTEQRDERVITLKMLKAWQQDLHTDKTNKTIATVVKAFHAALKRVSNEEDQEPSFYKVDGSSVFNGVVQLCVLELGPAIRRFLGLDKGAKIAPHKCKKFVKVKKTLKAYFTDLLRLLLGVSSSNIQTVLLKHLHYMSPMIVSYPNITKSLVKRLINLWGTADDSVRVIAFFCILRITNNQQAAILDTVLKSMYVTYVKNSKFVSTATLASINFMRRSLVEMFALDANVAYQHVFLYIRQLAIHLRNAITVNKKENLQSVYNWQFVNSLKLWGNLLSVTYHKPQLQQLLYPLVQVCLGTIKLVPTGQYYPLRYHIVQLLMELSQSTGVYIPILPFILEMLSYDLNKKHQKISVKPVNFTCILRLSKSQLQEHGFKDAIVDTVYGQLLEYLAGQSHSIAFPDLSLLCITHLKASLKKCKNPNYSRKLKQLLEKIEQNVQFIEQLRRKETFNLTDFKLIEGWEAKVRAQGTPLNTFYQNWAKLNKIKKNKQLTDNDDLADYKLPVLKKHAPKPKKDGPVELFPSDSEDDEDNDEDLVERKGKRGKRGGKNVNRKLPEDLLEPVQDNGQFDLVQDIDPDDW